MRRFISRTTMIAAAGAVLIAGLLSLTYVGASTHWIPHLSALSKAEAAARPAIRAMPSPAASIRRFISRSWSLVTALSFKPVRRPCHPRQGSVHLAFLLARRGAKL